MHFGAEVAEKVKGGQAKLVAWESIKDNLPIQPQDLPHRGNTTQIQTILINPQLVISPVAQTGRHPTVSQCYYNQNSPKGRYRPARSFPHTHHPHLCQNIGRGPYPNGQMGHQGQFLADGCRRGRRVELCVHFAAKSWKAHLPRGTQFPPNWVGIVTSFFLCCI